MKQIKIFFYLQLTMPLYTAGSEFELILAWT